MGLNFQVISKVSVVNFSVVLLLLLALQLQFSFCTCQRNDKLFAKNGKEVSLSTLLYFMFFCFTFVFCATKMMAQLPQKFLRVNKPYLNYIFSLTGRVKLNNFIVLSIVGIFLHWCYGKLEENYYWLSNFFLNYFVLLSFATITKKLVHSQYKICWSLRPSIL